VAAGRASLRDGIEGSWPRAGTIPRPSESRCKSLENLSFRTPEIEEIRKKGAHHMTRRPRRKMLPTTAVMMRLGLRRLARNEPIIVPDLPFRICKTWS
jgi:hypothetical protein